MGCLGGEAVHALIVQKIPHIDALVDFVSVIGIHHIIHDIEQCCPALHIFFIVIVEMDTYHRNKVNQSVDMRYFLDYERVKDRIVLPRRERKKDNKKNALKPFLSLSYLISDSFTIDYTLDRLC